MKLEVATITGNEIAQEKNTNLDSQVKDLFETETAIVSVLKHSN
jgi:hypothetical protein